MGSRKMIPHSSKLHPFPLRIWEAWDMAAVHRAMVSDRICRMRMADKCRAMVSGRICRMVMADRCRKMVTGRMAVLEHRHG